MRSRIKYGMTFFEVRDDVWDEKRSATLGNRPIIVVEILNHVQDDVL